MGFINYIKMFSQLCLYGVSKYLNSGKFNIELSIWTPLGAIFILGNVQYQPTQYDVLHTNSLIYLKLHKITIFIVKPIVCTLHIKYYKTLNRIRMNLIIKSRYFSTYLVKIINETHNIYIIYIRKSPLKHNYSL